MTMNSRQLADEIWKTVVNAYHAAHVENCDPDPVDREAALQEIEGLLERHAGMEADPVLTKAREENERNGLELS